MTAHAKVWDVLDGKQTVGSRRQRVGIREKWAGVKTWATWIRAKSLQPGDWVRASETVSLVGCSWSAVMNAHRQWSEDGWINYKPMTGCREPKANRCPRATEAIPSGPNRQKGYCGKKCNDGYRKNVSQHTMHRTLLHSRRSDSPR